MKKKFYGLHNFDQIPQLSLLSPEETHAARVVANVLPFRTNNYILDHLIDWANVPWDPVYQINFMQRPMLETRDFDLVSEALEKKMPAEVLEARVREIRQRLNPHPAGQLTSNVPTMDEEPVAGIQHKYRETCLVFPSNGQTCFAFCTFCFRWPQFTNMNDLKFATDESGRFQEYVKRHTEITDILITGGDPMIMNARTLEKYLLPFLEPEFDHIQSIRIGTKTLGHWPYRYLTDPDAEDILRLFEKVTAKGKHLAFMAHFNHPVELSTKAVQRAVSRIRSTGAQIRSQAPLLRNVNDMPHVWAEMWQSQVRLGIIPYYMFVERDTGARRYFEVPLADALDIYREAIQQVSGLARTVRGPSMSAHPGKVCLEGVAEIQGEKVFVLNFLQSRHPDWVKRPFFAKYDENAVWFKNLRPAFGDEKFFFEDDLLSSSFTVA